MKRKNQGSAVGIVALSSFVLLTALSAGGCSEPVEIKTFSPKPAAEVEKDKKNFSEAMGRRSNRSEAASKERKK